MPFGSDSSLRAMSGINGSFIRQNHQFSEYTIHQLVVIAAQVGTAYTEIKQRITAEQHFMTVKTNSARTMTGSMNNIKTQIADSEIFPAF